MFKFDTLVFNDGLEAEAAMLLSSLQNIATITPPVTIADIRSQIDTGQTQPITDDSFNRFLLRVHDLPLVYADLTTAEKTILNVIREEINPPVNFNICGGATLPIAAEFNLTVIERVGTATFEKQLLGVSTVLVPCNVAYIEVAITTGGGVASIPTDLVLNKIGTVDGLLNFSYLWLDFEDDPTGLSYDFDLDFKDADGISQGIISKSITM